MSNAVEAWKAGVKAARVVFNEHLAELLSEYSGMFAGVQGSTINIGQTKDELYALVDPSVPYLIILIEENPPPTVDVFTRVEDRRVLLDKLLFAVGRFDDDALKEIIKYVEQK